MKPSTITGKIHFSGEGKFDGDFYSYGPLEIKTQNGLVELPQVLTHKLVKRALKVGSVVSISVTESTDKSGKPLALIWAAHDHNDKRTYFNEEMIAIASALKKGIALGILGALIGLLFFVLPGLIIGWKVMNDAEKAKNMPSPDEMKEHVGSLKNEPTPTFEILPA